MAILEAALPLSISARPELTEGRRIGVLISHGFTGSPYSMRPWGEYLGELGYAVEVPRLPGHGTTWQEMNRTEWSDWYGELERTLDLLSEQNDAVVVAGLSMGGSLVLRLAADRPEQVAGVVLVNAGINMERKELMLLPILKRILPSLPGVANDIKKPGVTEGGYSRTPLKALDSMLRNWAVLRADLHQVTAPILNFRSTDDHVVDASSSQIIAAKVSSTDYELRTLTDSFHVATLDNDADRIFAESAAFIARVTATDT